MVRRASEQYFEQLATDIPNGLDVQALVRAIGLACREWTYRGAASYAPGATGVALPRDEMSLLGSRQFSDLARALKAAVAHNVLTLRSGRKTKGVTLVLIHLNRLLCPYFGLPTQEGAQRETDVRELTRWLDSGFFAADQARLVIAPTP